jgi:hypothetical protein
MDREWPFPVRIDTGPVEQIPRQFIYSPTELLWCEIISQTLFRPGKGRWLYRRRTAPSTYVYPDSRFPG